MRAVIDTNIWISAAIRPLGTAGKLIPFLRSDRFTPLFSNDTFKEVVQVLGRPRFATKYGIGSSEIRVVTAMLMSAGEMVEPTRRIAVCRDPKDDIFLEIAVAGNADLIVSGDADLLILHPFEGIPVVTLAAFLQSIET